MAMSMRGGIMQVEKRRTIPTILHFRLILFLLEIGLLAIESALSVGCVNINRFGCKSLSYLS